ncbi:MAG: crotonase/enoyl-CoA hydratase family protein [Pseudomonadota bacterium]
MAEIEVAVSQGVQTVRFNRAGKKNAITRAMYKAMADAVSGADTSDDIRVTVFLGQPEVFTSGNDLADFMAVATGGEKGTEVIDFLRAIIGGKKPLLAAVDGLAVGVGCTMLMHCDMVFASHRAWLQTPFVDLGLVPEAGSSLIAPRIMGHQRAFQLLAMGDRFNAEEAHAAGLVNEVVETEHLEARAMDAAARLAAKPPEALAMSRALTRGDRKDVMARMEEEGALFGERLLSDEARNAFMSFMNRAKAS